MRALVLLMVGLLAVLPAASLDTPVSTLKPAEKSILTAVADATLHSDSSTTNYGDDPYRFASYVHGPDIFNGLNWDEILSIFLPMVGQRFRESLK